MDTTIDYFVRPIRLAVVGVSEKKFGGAIYKTLKRRGYMVYGINPRLKSFDGDPCYADITEIPDDVSALVIAVSPANAAAVIDAAHKKGMTHIWFQQGCDFSEPQSQAHNRGMKTVIGKCILMYAKPVGGIHSVHRFFARAFGRL